jgi:hypothetical protein
MNALNKELLRTYENLEAVIMMVSTILCSRITEKKKKKKKKKARKYYYLEW